MTTALRRLTQDQSWPVGDPSIQPLVEDLMQKHDGLTGDEEKVLVYSELV